MCHVNTHGSSATAVAATMQSKRNQLQRQLLERQQSASSPMHKKLVNQLRPFRKVARSARINLNRYWGILSQRYGGSSSSNTSKQTTTSSGLDQYATEMEQNRINELLEAQACAISQNSLNSQYEEYSLRSRSSVASSSSPSQCQYQDCDCHLPVLMAVPKVRSPAPVPVMSVPIALHQRFASLTSSAASASSSAAPSPSFTGYTSTSELYYFNNSPRKQITMEDEYEFDEFESASQCSMIL